MQTYHIILDLEMNPTAEGLRSACNGLKTEVVEIGAIKVDAATNRVVDEFTCVVRPEFNRRIEPNITRLTGITTKEVSCADTFRTALANFVRWVGCGEAHIYSWSNTDYSQLRKECSAKHILFPEVFSNWTDFQAEFPKYLGYSHNRCFRLSDAAKLIGTPVTQGRTHRALYDAQITTQLVLFALTEAYKHYISKMADVMEHTHNSMTYSIGDACGGKLASLLARLNNNEERVPMHHERSSFRATAELVR